MSTPGYGPVPQDGTTPGGLNETADRGWVQRIASRVNQLLQGKFNAVLSVTLAANSTTTTVVDARISVFSGVFLQPTTTDAAAALAATPYVLVTSQQNGQLTLTHANAATTDRTFNLLVIG